MGSSSFRGPWAFVLSDYRFGKINMDNPINLENMEKDRGKR
ncbi:hypothetical protein HMPREF0620_1593 [Parascardovia denticolens DSM 10105 = JCM 12538]|uniref:Uncharacterized protein n=1 Tax=Parascardovia denticolens DSM 10105 = JCM 12538 TaxID=864564 RepID=E6K2C0_PARDN|nr:hypothetical protein HMPREF0620_1593 [Parascardovia denticolens DSM 10105 = JCM 12538]